MAENRTEQKRRGERVGGEDRKEEKSREEKRRDGKRREEKRGVEKRREAVKYYSKNEIFQWLLKYNSSNS